MNDLLDRFDSPSEDRMGQIVGPHGTGKSTLLKAIIAEIRRQGETVIEVVLRDKQRKLPPELHERLRELRNEVFVLTIDGYEQLSFFEQLRLIWIRARHRCGIIITAHRPAGGWPILYETSPSLEMLERVLRHLLKGETLISAKFLDRLYKKHNGNLRLILLDLYDEWEQRHKPDKGTINTFPLTP